MHAQGHYRSAATISTFAKKQLVKRESYTCGILSSSLPRFLEDHHTAIPLEVQVCKLGVVWCRWCMKINFCWRLHRRISENMHPRKYPTTVESPNKGHFGDNMFVPCREVVPISGVCLFLSDFQVYKRFYKDIHIIHKMTNEIYMKQSSHRH